MGFALLSGVGQHQLLQAMYGGTKVQLGLEDVRDIWLPVPPLDEQLAIAQRLHAEGLVLDEVQRKIDAEVLALHEYRHALVTAAVTGQLNTAMEPKEAA
jgi:type I restriction enzyme S subunit